MRIIVAKRKDRLRYVVTLRVTEYKDGEFITSETIDEDFVFDYPDMGTHGWGFVLIFVKTGEIIYGPTVDQGDAINFFRKNKEKYIDEYFERTVLA